MNVYKLVTKHNSSISKHVKYLELDGEVHEVIEWNKDFYYDKNNRWILHNSILDGELMTYEELCDKYPELVI